MKEYGHKDVLAKITDGVHNTKFHHWLDYYNIELELKPESYILWNLSANYRNSNYGKGWYGK